MDGCHIFSSGSVFPILFLLVVAVLISRHRLIPKVALISIPIMLSPSVTAQVVTPVALSHVPPMVNVAPPLVTPKRFLPTVAAVLVVKLTKMESAVVLSVVRVAVLNVLLLSLVPPTPLTASVVLPVPLAGLATLPFAVPRVRSKTVPPANV